VVVGCSGFGRKGVALDVAVHEGLELLERGENVDSVTLDKK
jgi:hypothetical protein